MSAPANLLLTNQFGEESINVVRGSAIPLIPESNVVIISGSAVPTDGVTGADVANTGSFYIRTSNGALYYNSGDIDTPAWTSIGAGTTSTLLTGFSSGAGTVSGSDTVLQAFNKLAGNTQNKTVIANVLTGFSASAGVVASTDTILQGLQKLAGYQANLLNGKPQPSLNLETLSAGGAISVSVMETLINNATMADLVMTLAAASSQDGQVKIIKLGTATTNGAVLAMTNIKGPGFCTLSGTTTLTFTSTGDCAILMAVGTKWMLIGGNAIAS